MNTSDTVSTDSAAYLSPLGRFSGVVRILMAVVLFSATLPVGLADASVLRATVSTPVAEAAEINLPGNLSDQAFLDETNTARMESGLLSLIENVELTAAAKAKAEDMLQYGYWNHFRPSDNKAPWDFIKESGYSYRVAGENLARGFVTASGTTNAWLASPTHRANLLSVKYTDVGFATVSGTDQNGAPAFITVQMFGSR